MPRLSSHLGQMASEFKGFVGDRFSWSHLRHAISHGVDVLFPPQGLDRAGSEAMDFTPHEPVLQSGFGSDRWARIRFLDGEGCDMCARPLDGLYFGGHCHDCLDRPFPFRRTRSACLYDEASRDIVLKFKHGDRTDLAPLLSRWIERAGADLLAEGDVIMPVPLHPSRLRARRYNQAAELARPLAKRLNKPYLPDALIRTQRTSPQGRDADARWANVKNAFVVSQAGVRQIDGRAIVLIDDVFTTGATLRACTRVLLKAGARSVDCLTVARAVKSDSL